MATELYEYLTEASTINFPFAEPVDEGIKQLIADVYIVYFADKIPHNLENATLTLGTIAWDGTNFSCIIRLSNDTPLFDLSAITPITGIWGTWKTFEWTTAAGTVKIVVNTSAAPITHLESHKLGVRSIDVTVNRVTSIIVHNAITVNHNGIPISTTPTTITRQNDVVLTGGFNTQLITTEDDETTVVTVEEQDTPSITPRTNITVDVAPGSGHGRYPKCLDGELNAPVLRLLNGIQGDELGNVNLELTDCYRYERAVEFDGLAPGTNPRQGFIIPGTLWLIGSCRACSKCSDYANLYKLLRQLYARAANLQQRFNILYNYYMYLRGLVDVYNVERNKPVADFIVIQAAENVYTLKVAFNSGAAAFNQIKATITPPRDFAVEYVKFNGWEKLHSYKPRQNDSLFANGLGFTCNQTIPVNSQSWWSWSIKLKATRHTPSGGRNPVVDPKCPTTYNYEADLVATISARQLTAEGGFNSWTWGPFDSEIEVNA